ncbi:MAG: Ldh family oxidoreductase [Bacilli bacterium]|nr:Ldh family oxidoreductase [Bacilli bacterium]
MILDWETTLTLCAIVGVPEDDAKIVADVLLESDHRGIESHHGCNHLN